MDFGKECRLNWLAPDFLQDIEMQLAQPAAFGSWPIPLVEPQRHNTILQQAAFAIIALVLLLQDAGCSALLPGADLHLHFVEQSLGLPTMPSSVCYIVLNSWTVKTRLTRSDHVQRPNLGRCAPQAGRAISRRP